MDAIHVVADLLEDQEATVAAVVHAEVATSVDHAQHDVAGGYDGVGVETEQHEAVLDSLAVAVVHDDDPRVLVARVKGHVRPHLFVAVDDVDGSTRL